MIKYTAPATPLYYYLGKHSITSFLPFQPKTCASHFLIPQLFNDGGPYNMEASPLICFANQWTGFYIIGTFVMKDLMEVSDRGFISA